MRHQFVAVGFCHRAQVDQIAHPIETRGGDKDMAGVRVGTNIQHRSRLSGVYPANEFASRRALFEVPCHPASIGRSPHIQEGHIVRRSSATRS